MVTERDAMRCVTWPRRWNWAGLGVVRITVSASRCRAEFDLHMVKPAPVEELRTTLERVARRISETISAS
jgi:hypothetical protein